MIKIDHEKSIAIIEISGTPKMSDIKQKIIDLMGNPEHFDGMDELWDFRNASLASLTAENIQALSSFVGENLDKLAQRTALVVRRNLEYGIGRMWEAYAEVDAPQKRKLFRDIEEAIDWLTT